jgi:hypothetical protein
MCATLKENLNQDVLMENEKGENARKKKKLNKTDVKLNEVGPRSV